MSEPVAISENALSGIKKAIQDFVAPEIRDIKGEIGKVSTRIDGLEKLMDARFNAMREQTDTRFKIVDEQLRAIREQMDAQTRIVIASLGELKALIGESRIRSEQKIYKETHKLISDLSERVKVLEVKLAV